MCVCYDVVAGRVKGHQCKCPPFLHTLCLIFSLRLRVCLSLSVSVSHPMCRSEKQLSVGGPLLTHCSAGVGRSGTLIALDIACQLLDANKRVDLVEVVMAIRNDRVALVQHPQQYELTHAGCVLYAEFVEAGVSTTETAKGAPVSFNRQGEAALWCWRCWRC